MIAQDAVIIMCYISILLEIFMIVVLHTPVSFLSAPLIPVNVYILRVADTRDVDKLNHARNFTIFLVWYGCFITFALLVLAINQMMTPEDTKPTYWVETRFSQFSEWGMVVGVAWEYCKYLSMTRILSIYTPTIFPSSIEIEIVSVGAVPKRPARRPRPPPPPPPYSVAIPMGPPPIYGSNALPLELVSPPGYYEPEK